jgi:hypothetical protein
MGKRPITLNASSPFEEELSAPQKREMWAAFLQGGTTHSARAATLPFIIRKCERDGVGYTLRAEPGTGYRIYPTTPPCATKP